MQWLSNRPLKKFTVGAVTTSVGKLFQTFTIRILKKSFFVVLIYNFVSSVSNCDFDFENPDTLQPSWEP